MRKCGHGCSRSMRTSVCRPRVHLIESTLDEGRGDHQERREHLAHRSMMRHCQVPSVLPLAAEDARQRFRRHQSAAAGSPVGVHFRKTYACVFYEYRSRAKQWRTSPWPRRPVSRRPTMSEARKVIWTDCGAGYQDHITQGSVVRGRNPPDCIAPKVSDFTTHSVL